MKPFYNLGYSELLGSVFRVDLKHKKLMSVLAVPVLIAVFSFLFLIYNWEAFAIMAIFAVCFLSMMHMRVFTWLGAIDMNTILTVYTTIQFGLPAGLIVGNASVLGNIVVGEIDLMIYDVFASMVVAFIGTFFTINTLVPAVIIAGIIYFVMGVIYLNLVGMMEWTNWVFLTTNLAWILFVMLKLYPLIIG